MENDASFVVFSSTSSTESLASPPSPPSPQCQHDWHHELSRSFDVHRIFGIEHNTFGLFSCKHCHKLEWFNITGNNAK